MQTWSLKAVFLIFCAGLVCSNADGRINGYPYLPPPLYLGPAPGGIYQGRSFYVEIKRAKTSNYNGFKGLLHSVLGVCDLNAIQNFSCDEWALGRTYFVITIDPEESKAAFFFMSYPPESIPARYAALGAQSASGVPGAYINHGPKNPLAFQLPLILTGENQLKYVGKPFLNIPLALNASFEILFDPRPGDRRNIETDEDMMQFLRFENNLTQGQLTVTFHNPGFRGRDRKRNMYHSVPTAEMTFSDVARRCAYPFCLPANSAAARASQIQR